MSAGEQLGLDDVTFSLLDRLARQHYGGPLLELSPADAAEVLDAYGDALRQRAARLIFEADQGSAVLEEAAACGCTTIQAEAGPDGRPILSTGRVVHTCGRPS